MVSSIPPRFPQLTNSNLMPIKVEQSFTITTNARGLLALYKILSNIGGSPGGPRKEVSKILREIEQNLGALEDERDFNLYSPFGRKHLPSIYIDYPEDMSK